MRIGMIPVFRLLVRLREMTQDRCLRGLIVPCSLESGCRVSGDLVQVPGGTFERGFFSISTSDAAVFEGCACTDCKKQKYNNQKPYLHWKIQQ